MRWIRRAIWRGEFCFQSAAVGDTITSKVVGRTGARGWRSALVIAPPWRSVSNIGRPSRALETDKLVGSIASAVKEF